MLGGIYFCAQKNDWLKCDIANFLLRGYHNDDDDHDDHDDGTIDVVDVHARASQVPSSWLER